MKLEVNDILSMAMVEDSIMADVIKSSPKRFISSEIRVPVWKVEYRTTTKNGNVFNSYVYLFHREDYWDSIENDFMSEINVDRSNLVSLVITNAEYLGEMILELNNN